MNSATTYQLSTIPANQYHSLAKITTFLLTFHHKYLLLSDPITFDKNPVKPSPTIFSIN